MKKLTLNKETIRNLDNDILRRVQGGKYNTSEGGVGLDTMTCTVYCLLCPNCP